MIPVVDKKTKAAKTKGQEKAIFRLFSLGIVTNRDEWAYDASENNLKDKISYFIEKYESERIRWRNADSQQKTGTWVDRRIKWTSELEKHLQNGRAMGFDFNRIRCSCYRPFVKRYTYYAQIITHRIYQQDSIFHLNLSSNNDNIILSDPAAQKPWMVSSVDEVPDLHYVGAAAGAVCLPRYRYTPTGERVDNITDWALKQFRAAYGSEASSPGGSASDPSAPRDENVDTADSSAPTAPDGEAEPNMAPHAKSNRFAPAHREDDMRPTGEPDERARTTRPRKPRAISKDDIFHYVYAVLHDPVYRETYALNLKREFPRIPFYPDFRRWAAWGERLMALHIGYESVEPWPLERLDMPDEAARANGVPPKAMLKADREAGIIRLDTETQLSGIPPQAWTYRLGNRSGVDWILDQYKEKTPKDPTIRERFNTYRFADHKETVIDLIARVCRVSVETVEVTEAMRGAKR